MKINALEINLEVDEKEEILTSFREVLDSKIEWTNASKVFELEKQICQSYGCKHAVMLSSGSTAIQAALIALGITSQDIVYCPVLTAPPTIISVLEVGAKVVYVDCLDDFGMDPVDLEQKIKCYGTNGAIIPVHVGGIISTEIEKIVEIGNNYFMPVIEDCAHAHGSTLKGKVAGNFGTIGTFSFFLTKTLTAGEGGLVITNNSEIDSKLRKIRNYGKNEIGLHEYRGSSWRMNEFTAVVVLNQIVHQDAIIKEKRNIAKQYDRIFEQYDYFKVMNCLSASGFYKYILPLNTGIRKKMSVKEIENILKKEYDISLPARVYERLCNEEPYLFNHENILNTHDTFLNAEQIKHSHLCLPIYRGLNREKIQYICNSLIQIIGY